MKISEIKNTFSVRKINQSYVEMLIKKFQESGYESAYPISVTKDGVLWDGNHRLVAVKALGWQEIPHIIETPENIRQAAHKRNDAAANALPETFVDHAEEIWSLLADGKTQQQVADEIGWSLDKVKKYVALDKISPPAWCMVTQFSHSGTFNENGTVTVKVTDGTFNENLLRNILTLTEIHQIKIITGLIGGTIKKNQVKNQSKTFADREAFAEYAIENLHCISDTPEFFNDCINGLYSSIAQIEKAVSQANDDYEKRNSIRIMQGDSLILLNEIKDNSCDALVTDPPYMILDEEWDSFPDKETFLTFSRTWIKMATCKIKPTGRIYIFWSQELMFDFPFDAVNKNFSFGNLLIWNYKNNIKPNNRKIYKHTYEPIFYFYGNHKDTADLNLPKNKEWGEEINDYDMFIFAQPQKNFSDKKIHPAQKPEKLITQIVAIGTDIGDTVLDCFAGSGTIGVICKQLKRKAILIEKDKDHIKKIHRRINEHI